MHRSRLIAIGIAVVVALLALRWMTTSKSEQAAAAAGLACASLPAAPLPGANVTSATTTPAGAQTLAGALSEARYAAARDPAYAALPGVIGDVVRAAAHGDAPALRRRTAVALLACGPGLTAKSRDAVVAVGEVCADLGRSTGHLAATGPRGLTTAADRVARAATQDPRWKPLAGSVRSLARAAAGHDRVGAIRVAAAISDRCRTILTP